MGHTKIRIRSAGSMQVIKKISTVTYQIKCCKIDVLVVVHVDHLQPYVTEELDSSNYEFHNTCAFEVQSENDSSSDSIEHIRFEQESFRESPQHTRHGRIIKPPTRFSP